MFFLNDLPDSKTMSAFAQAYPEMEVTATSACLRLFKTASVLLRQVDHKLAAHGLSQARFLGLVVLERAPAKQLSPVEIARQMGTSKKNTMRLLAFMEQDELVTRRNDESDGRASVITITGKGSNLLSSALPTYYQTMNSAMRPLDEASRDILIRLLDQVSIVFPK